MMSPLPLNGLSVMVTRPAPAGTALCEFITTQGGQAIHFPTIAFEASNQPCFDEAITQLGEQAWLIFISPQAVTASVPAIRRAWPHLPPQVQFAAVGAGTARALHDAGYQVSVFPQSEWNSESLLALPIFQAIKGQKIAVIRGEGGRELIDQTLASRGALVTPVIAYKRVLPKTDMASTLLLFKQHKVDAVICSSFAGVQHFKILMGEAGWAFIRDMPLIVVSERIKRLAEDLGFQTIWVAQNASHAAIVEILAQKRNVLCQTKTTHR